MIRFLYVLLAESGLRPLHFLRGRMRNPLKKEVYDLYLYPVMRLKFYGLMERGITFFLPLLPDHFDSKW